MQFYSHKPPTFKHLHTGAYVKTTFESLVYYK